MEFGSFVQRAQGAQGRARRVPVSGDPARAPEFVGRIRREQRFERRLGPDSASPLLEGDQSGRRPPPSALGSDPRQRQRQAGAGEAELGRQRRGVGQHKRRPAAQARQPGFDPAHGVGRRDVDADARTLELGVQPRRERAPRHVQRWAWAQTLAAPGVVDEHRVRAVQPRPAHREQARVPQRGHRIVLRRRAARPSRAAPRRPRAPRGRRGEGAARPPEGGSSSTPRAAASEAAPRSREPC